MPASQSKRLSCSLGGALPTVTAIRRAIPILHAGPGCGLQLFMSQSYGGGFQGSSYIGGGSLPSTNTQEREVIFGGEDRLREIIRSSIDLIDGDAYVVLTGCTAAIIGDDVGAVVNEFAGNGHRLAHVEVGGVNGNTYDGYNRLWEALAKQWVTPRRISPTTVNLFGVLPKQDIFWQGNLLEISRLLTGLGLTVNSFLVERQGIEAVDASSEAALNIILSPHLAEGVSQLYEEKFGIPSLRYPGAPIGPTATADFLTRVADALKIPDKRLSPLLDKETIAAYDLFAQAALSLTGFQFQKRFAIIGDSGTVISLTRFLSDDLGQIPILAVVTDEPPETRREEIRREIQTLKYADPPEVLFSGDYFTLENAVRQAKPHYILGSTLDKDLAKSIDAAHLSVSFPVTDRVVLNRAYAGFNGGITLIEDFIGSAFSAL